MQWEGTTLTASYAARAVSALSALQYNLPGLVSLHHTWQDKRSLINEKGCVTAGQRGQLSQSRMLLHLGGWSRILGEHPWTITHRFTDLTSTPICLHTPTYLVHIPLLCIDIHQPQYSSWSENHVAISHSQATSRSGLCIPCCCLGVDITAYMVVIFTYFTWQRRL